jgi:hypothetical protein
MLRGHRVSAAVLALSIGAGLSLGVMLAPAADAAGGKTLVGTFSISAGSCSGGASGSYIRMILPSGTASGPYMSNSDSTCNDETYTLLRPGADGGLVTGSYQKSPSPAFDSKGNALADRITAPAVFYGTGFATATSPTDPQTGKSVPAPSIVANGSKLTANLSSFAVTWNNQNFNQGAPKPGGTYPGNTHAAAGTYNASTGAYTLQWTSQVVGGPFNNFTGLWHLTGKFIPANASPSQGQSQGQSKGQSAPGAGKGSTQSAQGSTSHPSTSSGAASTATSSAASSAPAGVLPSGAASTGGASPAQAHQVSATTSISHGWRAPVWLLVLIAVVAVVALLVLFNIQRAISAASKARPAA